MVAGARETEPMTAAGAWKAEADLSTARSCRVGTHRGFSEVLVDEMVRESSLILVVPPYCFCATVTRATFLKTH